MAPECNELTHKVPAALGRNGGVRSVNVGARWTSNFDFWQRRNRSLFSGGRYCKGVLDERKGFIAS